MVSHILTLAALVGGSAVISANPQVPTPKPVTALQNCRIVADAATRLSCYDQAAEALARATASNEIVIVEREEVRKVRRGLFGFTMPRVGFLTGRQENVEDKSDTSQLLTVVTEARSIGNGKWRFTVESGANWETLETNIGFLDPLPGRKVLLQSGSLGSYYAQVGNGRRVQAKRIG